MGIDDIKDFEKKENQSDSIKHIKESKEIEATKEIENLFRNEYSEVANKIETIKNIINSKELEYKQKTSFMYTSTELVEVYENHKINKYNINKESPFSILEESDINFFRDAFITIGGNSSSGKTSLAVQLVKDILISNHNAIALFYSLDDGAFMGLRRLISHLNPNEALAPYTEIITKESVVKHHDVMNRIIFMDTIELSNIETDVELLKLRFNHIENPLIIIAIDYLHLIPNTTHKDYRLFLNDVVRNLKNIQKNEVYENKNGCMFFMISQINRSSKNETDINSFRETSEIENISDIALTIDYIDKKDVSNSDRKIKIVKNKIGIKKTYKAIIKKYGIIECMEETPNSKGGYRDDDDDNIAFVL